MRIQIRGADRIIPIVVMLALTLQGCTKEMSDVSSPSASSTPISLTATLVSPSATPFASIMPTLTPTRSFTLPTSSPPIYSGTDFDFLDFLIEDNSIQDCQLPCWRGLVVGKSNWDDVIYVFDSVFGVNGQNNVGMKILGEGGGHIEAPYYLNYVWDVEDDPNINFSVVAALDRKREQLEGLAFYWTILDSSLFHVYLSPQDVIKAQGEPTSIFAGIKTANQGNSAIVDLMLIYENGIIAKFSEWYPRLDVDVSPSDNIGKERVVQYCLGDHYAVWGGTDGGPIQGEVRLVDPMIYGSTESRLATVTNDMIKLYQLVSVEKALRATKEEITQLALQGDDNCIYSKNIPDS